MYKLPPSRKYSEAWVNKQLGNVHLTTGYEFRAHPKRLEEDTGEIVGLRSSVANHRKMVKVEFPDQYHNDLKVRIIYDEI